MNPDEIKLDEATPVNPETVSSPKSEQQVADGIQIGHDPASGESVTVENPNIPTEELSQETTPYDPSIPVGAAVTQATEIPEPQGVDTPQTPTLTFGQKIVGTSFNPSGLDDVAKVKELYAQIIDICAGHVDDWTSPDKVKMLNEAITAAVTAQMRAVKGITFRD